MKPLRPPDKPIRLRPRDGEPRCLIEIVAQFMWRWRTEAALLYIALAVSFAVLLGLR